MCCDIIQGAACGEGNPSVEALGLDQVAYRVLQALTHVDQLDSRLRDARDVLPHLHATVSCLTHQWCEHERLPRTVLTQVATGVIYKLLRPVAGSGQTAVRGKRNELAEPVHVLS